MERKTIFEARAGVGQAEGLTMTTTLDNDVRVTQAEEAIQKILLDLEEELGASVEFVDVDTHNFCLLRTSIFLTNEKRL